MYSEELQIILKDKQTNLPVIDAAVYLTNEKKMTVSGITDEKGLVRFNTDKGQKELYVQHINYGVYSYAFTLKNDTIFSFALQPKQQSLKEIVVTASESKGITSSSVISKDAMEHLQPSAFTDLLSLLPGGTSSTPLTNKANLIRLREADNMGENYATGSLGTSFVVDGAPISTDANMQYITGASSNANQDYYRNTTGKGVDMRTISTDEIEKVEIVRGIPSVEYGELTSGLVKIERKTKTTPWEARFKTDGFGKLFYVGKGLAFNEKRSTLNAGLDYLDSKNDPRNTLQNYKRVTASARMVNNFHTEGLAVRWRVNADYTGSFDNDKVDPDLNYMKEDSYHSAYNRMSLNNQLRFEFENIAFLKSVQLDANASYQADRIEQTRFISIDRDRLVPSNTGAGEHDGLYLPYQYVASHLVDGKPLSIFTKLKGDMAFKTWNARHAVIAGVEWKMDKNYGDGQVFDITRPLFYDIITRPRAYSDIPANHLLSFFVEDVVDVPVFRHRLKLMAGIRGMQLLNLNSDYDISNKLFLDPRINLQWTFPGIQLKEHKLVFTLSGGIGQHTKMPTLSQLYPPLYYKDIIQLNYFHENPDYRRLNILTYVIDPTNYDLQPAKNLKWEARLGIEYNRNDFSLTLFREDMTSGFRSLKVCMPYTYKKYDASGIDHSNITAQPELSELPYTDMAVLETYAQTTNGSRILKEGIEFQYASPRLKSIKTRFTVNGAWFRTTYTNSQAMFSDGVTKVIDNVPVNDLYIGYYDWKDGSVKELFNTNMITDTHLEKLGLTFSLTFQFQWYTSSQTLYRDGVPVAYMDNTGQIHEYTEADKTDIYKQHLIIRHNSEGIYVKRTVPFAGYFNFKATKSITKYMKLAFFVDKLFDYLPDYTVDGVLIRRNISPYFGMELNVKI